MSKLMTRVLGNLGVKGVGKGTIGPDLTSIKLSIAQTVGLNATDRLDKPYSDSVWVYAAVNAIANNLTKVPLLVYNRGTNVLVENPTDPVVTMFSHPNVYTNKLTFLFLLSLYIDIYGESFIVMDRKSPNEVPKAIYAFSPTKFKPVISRDYNSIIGWEYTKGSETIPLQTYEVCQYKYPSPYDDIRGFSPLEAGKLSVEQDFFAAIFNKNFFREGVRVSGYISVPTEMNDTSFNRLIDQFENRHQGMNRAHRIAVIDNDGKFIESKITQRDMEYIELRRMSRQEIFAIYKVNEVVLGLYNEVQSYEGVKMAHKSFWEEAMLPRLMYLEEFFNYSVLDVMAGGKYEVKFDLATVGALHDDYSVRVSTAKTMVNMGWPINAVNERLELGMKPVEWGDTWWVPMGMLPVDRVLAEADATIENLENEDTSAVGPYEEDEPTSEESDEVEDEDEDEEKPKPSTEAEKALWSKFLAVQTRLEEQTRSRVKKFFFDQRKQILENLYSGKTKLIDINKETRRLQRILGGLYLEGIRLGADMIRAEAGVSEEKAFSIKSELQAYAQTRLKIIPAGMMKTVVKQLNVVVQNKSYTTREEVAEAIRGLYNKTIRRVNNVIARTESSSVIVVGRILQMQRLGVRRHKWVSSKIDRGRDAHANLNGRVRIIGESFKDDEVLRYPCDLSATSREVIGCRCFTVIAETIKGGFKDE